MKEKRKPGWLRNSVNEKIEQEAAKPTPPTKAPAVLNDLLPIEDRSYVVGHRGTDEFLESKEATGWDTVKWDYTWTTERKKVQRFDWEGLVESGLMMNLVIAYGASVFMLRVK